MRKLIILLFFLWGSAYGVVRDIVEAIDVVRFDSRSQRVVDGNTIILEGDVEVFVGPEMMRVRADKVVLDRAKKTVNASCKCPGGVQLETETFLMLADFVQLNIEKRTGSARNIRLSMEGSYISAREAEKIDDDQWYFKDVSYSACDKLTAHWKFHASSAHLKKYVVKAKGLYLKLGGVPILFFPGLVFPGQSQKKSGFLTPRLYFGGPLGIGFKQEFYWHLKEKMDTTVGLQWREKKGFILFDEYRWARDEDMYTVFNGQVARELNAFKERAGEVKRLADMRYWIYGDNYHTFKNKTSNFDVNTLARVDFGTDKKINYDFFGSTDSVDDHFQNDVIVRVVQPSDLYTFAFERDKFMRDRFSFPSASKVETEERIRTMVVPHFQWDSAYKKLRQHLSYQHTFFTDQAFLERHSRQKNFVDNKIISTQTLNDLSLDTVRFWYKGSLRNSANRAGHTFVSEISPYAMIQSRLADSTLVGGLHSAYEGKILSAGAFRTFCGFDMSWSPPEYSYISLEGMRSFYLQPTIGWSYVPHFRQNHWAAIDKWDRIFAKNCIETSLRGSLYWDWCELQYSVRQGYDFYGKDSIFPLRRSPWQRHLTPFEVQYSFNVPHSALDVVHEFDLNGITHLASQVGVRGFYKSFDIGINLLYQKPAVLRERELLSDVPSFANFFCAMPINRGLTLHYQGHLYSGANSFIGAFESFNPISHTVHLDYKGHCWGFVFGFEERRFRQQGRIKSEQAFMFSFKLDTLGSFAKHFKREATVLKAPDGY